MRKQLIEKGLRMLTAKHVHANVQASRNTAPSAPGS